jgi:N-acetylmuramoyl-L-alanine amidase
MTMPALPAHWQSMPSPNHSARRVPVSAIVLHADASPSVKSSLAWVRLAESRVSYHLMVGRDGTVFSVVHPDRKAWHAGVSRLGDEDNVNEFSVGVCLSNRNDGVEPFPMVQQSAAADVCAVLCGLYQIDVARITTHAIVARPAGRKSDPKGLDLVAFREMVKARLAVTRPAP